MKLYGAAFSPYVQRCLMVARAKGREIPLASPPPDGNWQSAEYRAINPLAKVPCLDDAGFILPESGPIADYLDATLPGPALWPSKPRDRARAVFVARMVDLQIGPGVSILLGHVLLGLGGDDALQRAARQIARGMDAIAHFRDDADPWVHGSHFSHADAALMPMLAVLDQFPVPVETDPGLGAYWSCARREEAGQRLISEMRDAFAAFLSGGRHDRI